MRFLAMYIYVPGILPTCHIDIRMRSLFSWCICRPLADTTLCSQCLRSSERTLCGAERYARLHRHQKHWWNHNSDDVIIVVYPRARIDDRARIDEQRRTLTLIKSSGIGQSRSEHVNANCDDIAQLIEHCDATTPTID